MKKILALISVVALVFVFYAQAAAEPMFAWDASTGATGYIMYGNPAADGVSKTNPSIRVDMGNVTTYPVLSMNTPYGVPYQFAVSAYNNAGESGLSNTVEYTRPTFVPPPNITLPPITTSAPSTVTITINVQ